MSAALNRFHPPGDDRYRLELKGEKIFVFKPEDQESMDALELLYPQGKKEFFYSKIPGKNFVIYSVSD